MTNWLQRTAGTIGVASGFLLLAGGPAQAQDAQPLPVSDPQQLAGMLDGLFTPSGGSDLGIVDGAAPAAVVDPASLAPTASAPQPVDDAVRAVDGVPALDAVPTLDGVPAVDGVAPLDGGTALDGFTPGPDTLLPALIGDALTAQHAHLFGGPEADSPLDTLQSDTRIPTPREAPATHRVAERPVADPDPGTSLPAPPLLGGLVGQLGSLGGSPVGGLTG